MRHPHLKANCEKMKFNVITGFSTTLPAIHPETPNHKLFFKQKLNAI
jgi:hypothetical protein